MYSTPLTTYLLHSSPRWYNVERQNIMETLFCLLRYCSSRQRLEMLSERRWKSEAPHDLWLRLFINFTFHRRRTWERRKSYGDDSIDCSVLHVKAESSFSEICGTGERYQHEYGKMRKKGVWKVCVKTFLLFFFSFQQFFPLSVSL